MLGLLHWLLLAAACHAALGWASRLTGQSGDEEPVLAMSQDDRRVHAVVAGRVSERRPKYLYALVAGCPLLKPAFLDRCGRCCCLPAC